jgi:hypothetical protein
VSALSDVLAILYMGALAAGWAFVLHYAWHRFGTPGAHPARRRWI